MLFRVALALGKTVGELEATVGNAELQEWFEFYRLEPWGYHIENFWAAMGPWIATRIAAGKKAGSVRLENFKHKPRGASKVATPEQVYAALGVTPPWLAKSTSS